MVGTQISSYQVQEYLASGGVGHVYRAWDTQRQQPVALKLLKPELMRDKRAVTRFWREGQAAAQLNHRFLVKVYESGRSEQGYYFMAMEYIDGGSLVDLLKEYKSSGQPLPLEKVLTMMQQVAKGVDYAHRSGVTHRDLKPSNILLRPDGTVAIADLGVASFSGAAALTQVNDMVGTPEYMAPEQIQVDGKVDARTDVYALGVILYEMLAGERPFAGNSPWTVLHKQLHEQPKPLHKVRRLPTNIINIVNTCLQKAPEKRYNTARDLYHALEYAARQPETSLPFRWSAALLVGLALILIILLAFWVRSAYALPI